MTDSTLVLESLAGSAAAPVFRPWTVRGNPLIVIEKNGTVQTGSTSVP